MMELSSGSFISRSIRSSLGDGGKRTIKTFLEFSDTNQGDSNVIVSLTKKFTGFILNLGTGIIKWGLSRISFQGVFTWLISTTTRIVQFDWNQSDTDIQELQRSNNLATVSQWGSAVGAGLGWLTGIAVGYGIGSIMPVIGGGVLAKALAGSVTKEALEEMKYYLIGAITSSAGNAMNNQILNGYMKFRRMVKGLPDSVLDPIFGETGIKWIREVWGSESAPIFTISQAVEDDIERISNPYIRTFVESGVDEFFESFIESGYIIAMGLDDAYSQYRMSSNSPTPNTPRAIKFYPDSDDSQYYQYSGLESEIKTEIEGLVSDTRILGSRELGEWVGQPAIDYIRAVPHRRKATIIYKSIPGKGFYNPDGTKARTATYAIPDLDAAISWQKLKTATLPYNWGHWRATANLDNGRQMAIYGASKTEALEKLKDLISLSTAEITSLSCTEELDRNPKRRKEITRMYPYKMKLLVRRYDPDGSSYVDEHGNSYTESTDSIDLWRDDEPENYDGLLI